MEKEKSGEITPHQLMRQTALTAKLGFMNHEQMVSQSVLGSERVKHERCFIYSPGVVLGPGRILTRFSFNFLCEGAFPTEADRQNRALIIGEIHIVSPLYFLHRPCRRECSFKLYFSQCFPKRTWQMNSILLN